MPSVLIVDNEPDIRFLLRRMAEQAEWYVAGEAASGQEALDCYWDLEPDVIVLDHRMPGLSGLELIDEVEQQKRRPVRKDRLDLLAPEGRSNHAAPSSFRWTARNPRSSARGNLSVPPSPPPRGCVSELTQPPPCARSPPARRAALR